MLHGIHLIHSGSVISLQGNQFFLGCMVAGPYMSVSISISERMLEASRELP
jgi:hypothetical protein